MREIKKKKKKKIALMDDTKKDIKDKKKKKEDKVLEENNKNSKSNIFITIISVLLFIASIGLGYICLEYSELRKDNNSLQDKIDEIKENIVNLDNDYITYNDELDKKKVLLKDKIEEYNIWLETIEKVK